MGHLRDSLYGPARDALSVSGRKRGVAAGCMRSLDRRGLKGQSGDSECDQDDDDALTTARVRLFVVGGAPGEYARRTRRLPEEAPGTPCCRTEHSSARSSSARDSPAWGLKDSRAGVEPAPQSSTYVICGPAYPCPRPRGARPLPCASSQAKGLARRHPPRLDATAPR